jgi:hypothetical protein
VFCFVYTFFSFVCLFTLQSCAACWETIYTDQSEFQFYEPTNIDNSDNFPNRILNSAQRLQTRSIRINHQTLQFTKNDSEVAQMTQNFARAEFCRENVETELEADQLSFTFSRVLLICEQQVNMTSQDASHKTNKLSQPRVKRYSKCLPIES